jgi:hypothetical protein
MGENDLKKKPKAENFVADSLSICTEKMQFDRTAQSTMVCMVTVLKAFFQRNMFLSIFQFMPKNKSMQ